MIPNLHGHAIAQQAYPQWIRFSPGGKARTGPDFGTLIRHRSRKRDPRGSALAGLYIHTFGPSLLWAMVYPAIGFEIWHFAPQAIGPK